MAVAVASVPYIPTNQHSEAYWKDLHRQAIIDAKVPDGFPERLNSSLAWSAADIQGRMNDFVVEFDSNDNKALDAGLNYFKGLDLHYSLISPETFPLPEALSARLHSITKECYNGVGFTVVRGIDSDKHSAEDNVAIYAAIASYVGEHRGFVDRKRQSVISHLVNAGSKSQTTAGFTPAYTNGKVAFHSDNSEIMGLYALETADQGGRIRLSSSFAIYNTLAQTRPDILHTLADEWVLDTFKDYKLYPPIRTPFLHPAGPDRITFRFSRYPMTGYNGVRRNPSLPAATPAQVDALDAVQFLAESNAVLLPIAKGSIAFVNDMAMVHSRESFREEEAPPAGGEGRQQRHLMKMFVRDPAAAWPVAASARASWERIYGANRADGGRDEEWWINFQQGQEAEAPTNG